MVAVAVALIALKARDQHQRPLEANDVDDVAKDVVPAPFVERFVEPLREAVVDDGREVLSIDAVVAVRDEQFLGPDQADGVEEFRADGVVPRFAAVQREQRHPGAEPAAQHRQHTAVLVVGVRGRVHRARGGLNLQQLLPCA